MFLSRTFYCLVAIYRTICSFGVDGLRVGLSEVGWLVISVICSLFLLEFRYLG